MKRLIRAGPILAVLLGLSYAVIPSSARAATAVETISVQGHRVPLFGYQPAQIERFLIAVQTVQHSTSLAFLSDASVKLRNAVGRTITRPGGMHVVETRSSRTSSPDGVSCGWAFWRVYFEPGIIIFWWQTLQTWFCWDGTNVSGVPANAMNGGGSWGWQWEPSSLTLVGWPAPSAWLSRGQGHAHTGWWIFTTHCRPWIVQTVTGWGWVYWGWSVGC